MLANRNRNALLLPSSPFFFFFYSLTRTIICHHCVGHNRARDSIPCAASCPHPTFLFSHFFFGLNVLWNDSVLHSLFHEWARHGFFCGWVVPRKCPGDGMDHLEGTQFSSSIESGSIVNRFSSRQLGTARWMVALIDSNDDVDDCDRASLPPTSRALCAATHH